MSQTAAESTLERPSHTIEDYMMTMYVMERDYDEIVAARLAEMFEVSPATVATTFKRMERDKWITNKGRGDVSLTDTGRAAAESVIRRHLLVECLLVEVLGVPIAETHKEAHGIEHAISPELEERIRNKLGDPKLCPHGNPFPGHEDLTQGWLPLTALDVGQKVIIRRIHSFAEGNQSLSNFLADQGILPGVRGEITDKLSFNQTLGFKLDDRLVTLGFPVARFIFAEKRV